MTAQRALFKLTRFTACCLVFGGITSAEYRSFGQEPAATEKPAPQQESTLDEFDEFFGKKSEKEDKKAKPDKEDKANEDKEKKGDEDAVEAGAIRVEVGIGQAVIGPAIRIAPAMRAGMAVDHLAEPAPEGAEIELDPRLNRLTKALKLERALLRRACVLTPEQEKTLDGWDAKWLQARLDSEEGKKLQKKLAVIPMGLPDVPFSTSRSVLIDLIKPELKGILSEEQLSSYQAEVDARVAFEKRSEVDAMVAIIDHHLMLNSEQRTEVEKVVSKMGTLPQEPLNYLRYGQYIPNMSMAPVLKHLNKYQRKILQGLQQVQFGSSGEEDLEIIEQ